MFIRKILPDIRSVLIKGVLLAAIVCMQGITRAEAKICFLPSGECEIEMTVQSESCKTWTSSEREQICGSKNGYVRASEVEAKESNGFTCTSALSLGDTCCPGWYYCTEKNCQDQGFKLKTQLPAEYYICTPCVQGGDTYYRCEPKPCNYDPENPDASTLADVCTNTNGKYCLDTPETNLCVAESSNGVKTAYVWSKDSNRRAGDRVCGKCEPSTEPPSPPLCGGNSNCVRCKGNRYYWEENLPGGCVTCTVAGDVAGKDYYCCNDITEYPIPGCTDDDDGACHNCEGPVLATGSEYINCYKLVPKKCGNENQYVDKSISGCYCRDYDYYLNANPTSLNFKASGGTKTVAVESTISTRTSTSSFHYDTETGNAGLCTVSDNGNGTVTVKCGINVSTTPSTSSFNVTQTPNKVTTTHPVLHQTIKIKVNGDTCYEYQFSQSCSQSGYVAEYRRKSESGAANCYECVSDNCPSGYTKGTIPSPAEGYDTTKTDHGSDCYKAKSCDSGCSTSKLSDSGCYNCTACGYAGQVACWSCSHMDTSCDASAGYVWNESSCSCIASGCTTGDVSKQSVSDCGSSGSDGWEYTYSGMSGGLKCGICTPKDCTGNSSTDLSLTNSNYSCTSCYAGNTQKFTCTCNLTEAICNASGKSFDSSTCTCKNCTDTCGSNGWVTSCTEGCSGDYAVTCTNKGSKCGSTCFVENKTLCDNGCSNGSCDNCTDTCSNHTWESSCTPGCDGDYAVSCDNKGTVCGTTCYTKTKTYCENGCSNGSCNGCTDTCSNHTWESSCTPGCDGDYAVSCDNKGTVCGTTCYTKTKTYCENGCSNGSCNGCTDTCSNHTWESSCTPGCDGDYAVTCDNKGAVCGTTCYTKTKTYCANGCKNGSCEADTCAKHDWVTSCTEGCNGNKKVTCTNKGTIGGSTCYEKSEQTCTNGCSNGECLGCTDTCAKHYWVTDCTAGCNGSYKVTCETKSKVCDTQCYNKTETYCSAGCSNGECEADTCAKHNWETSCTPGCNGDYKVTCTDKGTIGGQKCYVKTETKCDYGCSNGECEADTCGKHNWLTSCSKGCEDDDYKVICIDKGTIGGQKCYEKTRTYCEYGCSGGECEPETCYDHYWATSCTPGCSGNDLITCIDKGTLNGQKCYQKTTTKCDNGCENGECKAACTDTCANHSWETSCTKGCNGNYKVTCETKDVVCGTQCHKKTETYCDNGCSNGECKAASCTYQYVKLVTADLSPTINTTLKAAYNGQYPSAYSYSDHKEGEAISYYLFNRISSSSRSCTDGSVTKYETICSGTPKSRCSGSNQTFTSNGCTSTGYTVGGPTTYTFSGDEWGTCTSSGGGTTPSTEPATVSTAGRLAYWCANNTGNSMLTWTVWLKNSAGNVVNTTGGIPTSSASGVYNSFKVEPGSYYVCIARDETGMNSGVHTIAINTVTLNHSVTLNTSSMPAGNNYVCTSSKYTFTAGQTFDISVTITQTCTAGASGGTPSKWTSSYGQ